MDFLHDLGSFFWTLFWLFALVAYLFALFGVITDLFRDQELAGGWKAVWLLFLFFLPFLTALTYLIVRGRGMAERSRMAAVRQREAVDAYIRDVAGGTAGELAKAKELVDAGALTPEEFDRLKAKVLA
ncbi:Phospholipase_D-nuclease N-terminal [Pseudonocardia thermophila]|uniref:Phospholipase_D-nuclease N-terminal n=1 Tax=Pseudonocardia thermophila TaxID=1848 RepID=A0A1M7ACX6_PSETH|nr:SHOCT domain-containing protein [Pseudonocardia thermophila]SHL40516.1 Phospholipase_D-nuclease N-terminal [Pseudonocardia thermophila]